MNGQYILLTHRSRGFEAKQLNVINNFLELPGLRTKTPD